MRHFGSFHRTLVRCTVLFVRGVGVNVCFSRVALVMLIDRLKMVIGRGNVVGCGKMVVFA